MLAFLINFLGFQIVWLACAWGIPNQHPELVILSSLIFLGHHFATCSEKLLEAKIILRVLILGFIFDSILGIFHLVTYHSSYQSPFDFIQPWWMTLLWITLGASVRISFKWLHQRLMLAALLGLTLGPVSYFSGEKFGALSIEQVSLCTAVFSIFWAAAMPLMMTWGRSESSPEPSSR